MAEMTEHELIVRMSEGLRMSSDAAKMLGVMQRNADFLGISKILDEISKNAVRLATSKSMSEANLRQALNRQDAVAKYRAN